MFTHITAFGPFVTTFHVKMMFNHQYADRIFKPRNIAVAYTNFLSIASCRIVNRRYGNNLLVTEIRVVVSYLSFINNIFTKMMCRVVINNFKYSFKITREENNKIIFKKYNTRKLIYNHVVN